MPGLADPDIGKAFASDTQRMGEALQRGQASQELGSWSAGSATQSRDDLEIGIPTSIRGTVLSFSQIRCWVGCITSIRWRWLRLNKRIGDSRECRRANYCALQVPAPVLDVNALVVHAHKTLKRPMTTLVKNIYSVSSKQPGKRRELLQTPTGVCTRRQEVSAGAHFFATGIVYACFDHST